MGSLAYPREPWHIRYVAGDRIPAAVLAYERSLKPAPPPTATTEETDVPHYIVKKAGSSQMWVTDGIVKRLVNDSTEALILHWAGCGQLNASNDPFEWPATVVDDLHTLSRG